MSYSTGGAEGGDAAIIDQAYQNPGATTPTPCTDAINGTPAPAGLFLSDSILYRGALTISLPNLTVKQLFGASDTSNAVPQGTDWNQFVAPAPRYSRHHDRRHADRERHRRRVPLATRNA